MVRHQDVSVDANRRVLDKRRQGIRKHPIIALGEEDRGPIDAPENDVPGAVRGHETGLSGHTDLLFSRRNTWGCDSRKPWSVPGFFPAIVLYDVTSSYFEGERNEPADYGYSRDGKKGKRHDG